MIVLYCIVYTCSIEVERATRAVIPIHAAADIKCMDWSMLPYFPTYKVLNDGLVKKMYWECGYYPFTFTVYLILSRRKLSVGAHQQLDMRGCSLRDQTQTERTQTTHLSVTQTTAKVSSYLQPSFYNGIKLCGLCVIYNVG